MRIPPAWLGVPSHWGAGRSNQQIADEFVVELATVKKHVGHILGKLSAANRIQAVAHARAPGLLH